MPSSQPRLTCASPGVSSSLREATRPPVLDHCDRLARAGWSVVFASGWCLLAASKQLIGCRIVRGWLSPLASQGACGAVSGDLPGGAEEQVTERAGERTRAR
jgi:hypothetical protein